MGEFNEDFKNKLQIQININFYSLNNSIILFKIDSKKNYLILKTGKNFYNNKEIILIFNGQMKNISCSGTQKFESITINNLYLNLLIENNKIYNNNNNNNKEILLSNIFGINSSSSDERFDKKSSGNCSMEISESEMSNYIFIGGFYLSKNNQDKICLTSTNSLFGCFDELKIYRKNLIYKLSGNDFIKPCNRDKENQICTKTNCKSYKYKPVHNLDCSLGSLNTEWDCYAKDLIINQYENSSFSPISDNKNKSKIVKLIWKNLPGKSFCLSEIKTKNDIKVEFYTNSNNQLVMSKQNKEEIIYDLSSYSTYILLIKFNYENWEINIANESIILESREEINSFVDRINLKHLNQKCKSYPLNFKFKYDKDRFEKLPSQNTIEEDLKIKHDFKILWRLLPVIFIMLIIVIMKIPRNTIYH